MTKFINVYLESDHYILAIVDDYYIPNRKAFNKYHNAHDLLITDITQMNKPIKLSVMTKIMYTRNQTYILMISKDLLLT